MYTLAPVQAPKDSHQGLQHSNLTHHLLCPHQEIYQYQHQQAVGSKLCMKNINLCLKHIEKWACHVTTMYPDKEILNQHGHYPPKPTPLQHAAFWKGLCNYSC